MVIMDGPGENEGEEGDGQYVVEDPAPLDHPHTDTLLLETVSDQPEGKQKNWHTYMVRACMRSIYGEVYGVWIVYRDTRLQSAVPHSCTVYGCSSEHCPFLLRQIQDHMYGLLSMSQSRPTL